MTNSLLKISLLSLLGLLPASAIPVVNGDFETGDFTGWSRSGFSTYDTISSSVEHSGNFGGSFGAINNTSSISQTLTTTAGIQYMITYWLSARGSTSTRTFSTDFGGTPGQSFIDPVGFFYTQFSYLATATASTTVLSFTFRNDPNFWLLDDITVEEVAAGAPELDPSGSLLPMLSLFIGWGLVSSGRRRRPLVSS